MGDVDAGVVVGTDVEMDGAGAGFQSEEFECFFRDDHVDVDGMVGEVGHDGHGAAGIAAHPGELPVGIEVAGSGIGVHQVERSALGVPSQEV